MAGPGRQLQGALEAAKRRWLEHQRRDAVLAAQLRRSGLCMWTQEPCSSEHHAEQKLVHLTKH